MTGKRIRVLIVDDSLFMRAAIKKALEADGGFEVIGQGKNGEDGVRQCMALGPDVVTMDYNMPIMNGASAVREIMRQRPTPVIMFSAHTVQGARETFEALAAGAIDFVTKPGGEVSADLSSIQDELVRKLTAAAGSRPRVTKPLRAEKPATSRPATIPPTGPKVVVIGISTGGPAALTRVIPALPANTRFATIVVQHMPAQFTAALAERLNSLSAVEVREAVEGDVLRPGLVLVAPGGRHVELDDAGRITLSDGPLVHGCRPAADVTMEAAARVFGRRCIGVVMTGMGKDGAAGLTAIKRADGKTLAQDQESSVIYGMPKAAVEAGAVDDVAPLDDIAGRLRYM